MYVELKKRREALGKTQKEIAELSGISFRGYQNYELGIRKPSVDVAQKIAKVLKSTVEELFKSV